MKNLQNTIVENLMRFRPKNVNTESLKRFLTEQDDFIRRWEQQRDAKALFDKWESEVRNEGRVKLVKTNAYRDVTNKEINIPVSFWNNFVTIDSMTNAADVKTKIDQALEALKEQGVNLEDPTINIKIVSRASKAIASTGPNKNDNTGKKRIDHDYNGLLKFDAAGNITPAAQAEFDAKQKTDPQWGNKILAQKRGDAAANYIKSKGIKANITVLPEIHPTERSFIITAQAVGQEKYIAPMSLPDMTIKMTLKAEWTVSKLWSMAGNNPVGTFPTFYYRIEWTNSNNAAGSVMTQDDNNSGNNENNSRWMRKSELLTVAKTGKGSAVSPERNPLQANKSSNFAGAAGESQNDRRDNFLAGTGHFANKSVTNYVWGELTNGASKLVSQATGFNLSSWLSSTSATMGVTSDADVQIGQFEGRSFFGKLLATTDEINRMDAEAKSYYGDLAKAQSAAAGTKVAIEKTINLQEFAAAAAAAGIQGVSAEMSTDPKFWTEAAWFDATVNPATFGISLKENKNFFAGATFSKSPINK